MTMIEFAKLEQQLYYGCREYKTVLDKIPISEQILVYSFTKYKIFGEEAISSWCNRIGEKLGFESGSFQVKFNKSRKRRAAASPWSKMLFFPQNTSIHTIIHEFTHFLAEDTSRKGSIHNDGFVKHLRESLSIIKEYAEEWGIKVYTRKEIISVLSDDDLLDKFFPYETPIN